METVREILARHGVESGDQMDVNESYSIDVPGFDTLTIEKVVPERLSVAHHRVQRGDLMCDPEIVFRVESDGWFPSSTPSTRDSTGGTGRVPRGRTEIGDFRDERWTPSNEPASGRCPRAADERR